MPELYVVHAMTPSGLLLSQKPILPQGEHDGVLSRLWGRCAHRNQQPP